MTLQSTEGYTLSLKTLHSGFMSLFYPHDHIGQTALTAPRCIKRCMGFTCLSRGVPEDCKADVIKTMTLSRKVTS